MGDTHIVVVGEMGVGKTTVGRSLAAELAVPFQDSDVMIETTTGDTSAVIADRDGVANLHALELETFLEMCRAEQRSVIAPAASVVDHEAGREALAEHIAVWLTASDEVLAQRQGGHRRVLGAGEREALWQRRAPHFERVTGLTMDTGNATPDAIAGRIAEWLAMQVDGDI